MAKRAWVTPITIIIVLLAGFAAYLFLQPKTELNGQQQQSAVPVRTQTVAIEEFRDVIEALGTAKANESVEITSQQQGVVDKIYFKDGDNVKQGQLLVELNAREELAKVQELQFRLGEATRQLERLKNLAREKVTSQQQLEEQQTLVNQTQAQLEVAKAQLAQMNIYAPFDGQLGLRAVSPGSLVTPGDTITTLDDAMPIKVDFSVPELYFASLAVDQEIIARSAAYPSEQFNGRIETINSRIDPITRTVKVRAIIDNKSGRIRPGMLLQIILLRSIDDAIILPEKALLPIQNRQYVFVVTPDQRAKRVEVTIGRRKPGIVEITNGLKPGDEVVVEGIIRLRDGIPVTVQGAK
ncbi:efflux transporter periplasmic adaptor subunit [Idiomarina tyrosinivorans]|uniref:Efflux transporter periplasmic adaptor subunit n=2 Tax=Idiomarina tyrosinivorans TaxID=1445662 RepID=A0A432ZFB6_9GAMM|nr:efflux RND transporter periplasmic adaptor subunit [Idiomarina tyrosinivorans]RUO76594.1 efflux transporter periplasmic adaptor subunit [Idiomarina tyrosinivorans]